MKSFCTAGLIVVASLGWASNLARAESTYGAPSLLPLPSVVPVDSSAVAASYNARTASAYSAGYSDYSTYSQAQEIPPGAILSTPGDQRTAFGDELASSGCCDSCGCEPTCAHWFGGVAGLVMTRNRANPYWTSFETNNNPNQIMNTQDARADWVGGGQVSIGYGFCGAAGPCGGLNPCGCYGPGVMFTYWGLGQMDGFSEVTGTNNISTPINLGFVDIGARPASDFFDNASTQRIWRNDRVNNYELNFLQGPVLGNGPLTVVGLAGFRYFRFDERLTYGSAINEFGDNNDADEAYLRFRTANNLFGAQIGALLNYQVCPRVGVFFIPKVGVFANQMNSRTTLESGDGILGTINDPGPQPFDIYGHKSDVSLMGELDFGLNYAITPNFWVYGGYRVLGVNNLALADNQFLPYLADAQGYREIKQSGSVILHGGLFGVAFLY